MQVRDQQVDDAEAEPGGNLVPALPEQAGDPGPGAGRTSVRPLSTLDTADTDTPASAAISTRVLRRASRATATPFEKYDPLLNVF